MPGVFGVELLVVVFAAITLVGFLITYSISVALDHVTPDLPYISDTGGKPPESCVFSLVCNMAAVLELVIVYIRYMDIHTHYVHGVSGICCPLKVINYLALGFGVFSAFGFLLVANFQNDEVPVVHFIGAFIVFSAGLVYQSLQTHISILIYKSRLIKKGLGWILLRLFITVLSAICFTGAVVFSVFAGKYHRLDRNANRGTFIWNPDDGGFAYHVASTACEWAIGILFLLFFLTFHTDFRLIRLHVAVHIRTEQRVVQSQYEATINESTPLTT